MRTSLLENMKKKKLVAAALVELFNHKAICRTATVFSGSAEDIPVKYTSKEKLFSELGWETIEKRAYILGICLFHKIVKGETRPLIKSLLP